VLGADGAGAGCSGRAGWSNTAGLSAGVLTADDDPLSKVNVLRPARGARGDGDGANPEPSGSPASGELRAGCFPFLTRLRRYSRSSDSVIACRSVFPVTGFWGIRLHPNFLDLHRLHGPLGKISQVTPAFRHRWHCHRLLAPSQLRGR
jgi:hypothetical protein